MDHTVNNGDSYLLTAEDVYPFAGFQAGDGNHAPLLVAISDNLKH